MTEQEEFCCETEEVHEDLLKIVNETMPDETELYDLAERLTSDGELLPNRILGVL